MEQVMIIRTLTETDFPTVRKFHTGTDPADASSLPNRPPADLNSTALLAIFGNQPIGTMVGEFNATDPDAGATLTYHLVSGAGDDNNSLFTLDTNGSLKTATSLDYEVGSYLSIRVQVRDDENASFDKNFTIEVIHDPNKDDDNDGLTYSQEVALGTSDNNPDSDEDGI